MLSSFYSQRVDISALHASFINSKSRKAGRATVKSLIGGRPILSDELESQVKGEEILLVFKRIFPNRSGKFLVKPKKKKAKKVSPGRGK